MGKITEEEEGFVEFVEKNALAFIIAGGLFWSIIHTNLPGRRLLLYRP